MNKARSLWACATLALVLCCGVATAQPAAADRNAGEPLPLTLKAAVDKVPAGVPISLQGGGPVTSESNWAASVTLPDGKQANVAPQVATPGSYTVVWPRTDQPGRYRFDVKLPAEKLAASVTVEVIAASAYPAQVQAELGQLMQLVDKALALADTRLAKLPLSPAREDAKLRLKKLNEAVRTHREHQQKTLAKLASLQGRGGKDFPASFGVLNHKLSAWEGESRSKRALLQAQLAKSESDNVSCEQMERITEGLNLVSAMFNLVAQPFALVINFAKDAAANALAGWATSNLEGQTIIKEWTKNAPAAESVLREARELQDGAAHEEAVKSIPGLLVDASSYLAQKLFGAYCERFEGPVTAHIEAEFSEGGRKWWTYRMALEGKLTLRYAKQPPGTKAVALNGEFIGQATRFNTKEDALAVLFPKLASSTVKMAVIQDPVGLPYDFRPQGQGKIVSTVFVPNSFFIPVQGELVEDANGSAQMRLTMQAATMDIDAAAQVLYVMVSPLTHGMPVVTSFQLPFKSARFVLMRALKGETATLKVKREGQKMVAEDTLSEKRGSDNAHATYKLKLRTCNPGCS
jgi:hypothetical protein